MHALTFHAPGDIHHETVPDPGIRESTDVVVQVALTAICGSDLHVYRGHESGLDLGTVMGHEFLGEIVAVGRDVTRLAIGDRVVAPFTTSCGVCHYCSVGLTCRCTAGELFGWVAGGDGLHGAQADLVRVPHAEACLLEVPEGADAEEALFCGDVLTTGMFCAEAADVGPGRVAVVVGCGPVGSMAVVAAIERGAERVFAVDTVPERLELARRFGAEPLDVREAVEAVMAATDGRGADSVLEAVGSPQATRLAIDLVRPGGTVAACGVHTESTFAFAPGEAYDKNLTYRAGRSPARHYMPAALELVAQRRHDLGAIVSHRLPLAQGPEAYRMFDRKEQGCTKVILAPRTS